METTFPQNISWVMGRPGRNPSCLEINCQIVTKIAFLFALKFFQYQESIFNLEYLEVFLGFLFCFGLFFNLQKNHYFVRCTSDATFVSKSQEALFCR